MSADDRLSKLIALGASAIDQNAEALNAISQNIWAKPELQLEEKHAHEVLTTYLEAQGFKVSKQTPLETAFIARTGNIADGGINVGVICEYDALPGIGHACGHNLIAEAGIATSLALKAILDANPDIKAQVIVFGTPGEEGGGGKISMINQNCFDEADFCMMVHPGPVDVVEFEALSITHLSIVFHGMFVNQSPREMGSIEEANLGKEAHAAGAPWLGINALDAAVQCYNNISMLRQQVLPTCRIHGIIKDGGVKPNIIPQRSELQYYARAPTDKLRDALKAKMENCAKAAAVATGCTIEILPEKDEVSYSNIKKNDVLNALYKKHALSLGFTFPDYKNLPGPEKNFAGSTDMGNVSYVKPSIHPIYKIGNAFNHTKAFTNVAAQSEAQKPTLDSAKAMMMTAIEVVMNSKLLEEAKKEFESSE
eukprot:gene20170-22145_t